MRFTRALAVLLYAAASARADPLLPTKAGMTWQFAVSAQPPSGKAAALTVQITGTEDRGGKSLFKLETRAAGTLADTQLIAEDETGIHLYERTSAEKKAIIFNPPQTLVPGPLKIGANWELDDRAADTQMHQRWTVAAEEVVEVPAGNYHAFRFHCEQPWPISIAIDRWFAPGFGFVKEVTTTRGPTGRLLSRRTLVLKKLGETAPPSASATPPPQTAPDAIPASPANESAPGSASPGPSPPVPSASAGPPTIQLEVSSEHEGEPRTDFSSDTPNIFVHWAGAGLSVGATVRVAWIAEDVGDIAPPNFIVDETSTEVTRSDFAARFTLSRPRDGWAAGKYRVELYLEDALLQTLKVTIHD